MFLRLDKVAEMKKSICKILIKSIFDIIYIIIYERALAI